MNCMSNRGKEFESRICIFHLNNPRTFRATQSIGNSNKTNGGSKRSNEISTDRPPKNPKIIDRSKNNLYGP